MKARACWLWRALVQEFKLLGWRRRQHYGRPIFLDYDQSDWLH